MTRFTSFVRVWLAITVVYAGGCRNEPLNPESKMSAEATALVATTLVWSDDVPDSIEVVNGYLEDSEVQTPSCPHYDGIKRTLKLGVRVGTPPNDRIASFTFEGYKPFIAYERRVRGPKLRISDRCNKRLVIMMRPTWLGGG